MASSVSPRRFYKFGPFRLDASNCVLLRNGEAFSVGPTIIVTLLVLVENRGRIVAKEELLKAVWPDTIVEESNLSHNISVLRKVLGEDPGDQQYIQTIPKRGYRFVAAVSETVEAEEPDSGDPGPAKLAVMPQPAPGLSRPARPTERVVGPSPALLAEGLTEEVVAEHRLDRPLRLKGPQAEPGAVEVAHPVQSRHVAVVASACLVLGAVVAWGVGWILRTPSSPTVARFTIALPPGATLPTKGAAGLAFSPDGSRLAYVVEKGGKKQIYLRALNEFQSKPVGGTEGAFTPAFSPDGHWIAFWASGKWKKVSLDGVTLATLFVAPPGSATFASWGPDDTLVFGVYPAAMWRIPVMGGKPQEVPIVDPNKDERWGGYPQFLPGGRAVTYNFRTKDIDSADDFNIGVFSFETGRRKTLIQGGATAYYMQSGHLVYIRSGALYAVPFDTRRLAVTGPPMLALDGVFENMATVAAFSLFATSTNGSLAYAPGGPVGGGRKVVWVDRQGKLKPLPLPLRAYLHPRLSPDERQLAIEVEGPNHDIYLYDMYRGTLTRMTFDGSSHSPLWTPDGKRITYRVGMPAPFRMWWMPADRSGPAEQLTNIGTQQSAASWSPDGRVLAFTQVSAENLGDAYVLEVGGGHKPQPFAQSRFDEGSPRFSPDGRWIAFCSNESGREEIYVQAYPGPGPRIQVSVDGGRDPVWRRYGGELYYRDGDKMMAVMVTTRPPFTASRPKVLWEGRYNYGLNSVCGAPGPSSSNYDVTADGQKFLMVQEDERDVPATEIRVVLNWSEEVNRLIRTKKN